MKRLDSIYGAPRESICRFLDTRPFLVDLLNDAVDPLQEAFGEPSVQLVPLDTTLKDGTPIARDFIVLIAVDVPHLEARSSLLSFYDEWWLANYNRGEGKVTFDLADMGS